MTATATGTPPGTRTWQDSVWEELQRHEVRQVAYVPDAGHSRVIEQAQLDPDVRAVVCTTEEEGVGVVSGAWLGGDRAVLLMQSSGVGNCVNAFSLLTMCQFPFVTLVTMRGEYAEFNPWQSPMGRGTRGALELMGITVLHVDRPDEVQDTVSAALESGFGAGERVAVLLGQKLLGRKKWERQG